MADITQPGTKAASGVTVQPIAGRIGAEISGVDISQPLDPLVGQWLGQHHHLKCRTGQRTDHPVVGDDAVHSRRCPDRGNTQNEIGRGRGNGRTPAALKVHYRVQACQHRGQYIGTVVQLCCRHSRIAGPHADVDRDPTVNRAQHERDKIHR